jgi:hypothetical protein
MYGVFAYNFDQNVRMKIYSISFRPKKSFAKSIPGRKGLNLETAHNCDFEEESLKKLVH